MELGLRFTVGTPVWVKIPEDKIESGEYYANRWKSQQGKKFFVCGLGVVNLYLHAKKDMPTRWGNEIPAKYVTSVRPRKKRCTSTSV